MSLISYVNGRYVPHKKALVHIEDRGYQFADGVYEVIACYNKSLIDLDSHINRLRQSLSELAIKKTVSPQLITIIINELLRRNGYNDAYIYLQITRGTAKRNHSFPSDSKATLVLTATQAPKINEKTELKAYSTITQPDIRWKKCHIKSIALLPNTLAKQSAVEKNALEAIMVNDQNIVTEGSASNIFIVTKDNALVTHPANNAILGGITRTNVIALAKEQNIKVEERPFTLEEAKNAKEVFITSTTKDIVSINQIDADIIGNGSIGITTQTLHEHYLNHIRGQIHT